MISLAASLKSEYFGGGVHVCMCRCVNMHSSFMHLCVCVCNYICVWVCVFLDIFREAIYHDGCLEK